MNREGIILVILGLGIAFFSHPRIANPAIKRMFNEGFVTPRIVKPEKAELIKYAGPNLSLLLVGIIFVIIGLVLIWNPG